MKEIQKIAFVYDWFDTSIGGAERIVKILHVAFPLAPWYTSHVDYSATQWAKEWDIRPSFIQKLPLWFRRNRLACLALFPLAFEGFDFSEYDVVVSVTSAFAKGIITKTQTNHLCYLLTPPRWLYKLETINSQLVPIRWLEEKVKKYLQRWDSISAQRVDTYISISKEVAQRCNNYYKRESEVIYPPFDAYYWKQKMKSEHLISHNDAHCISRFTKYVLIVSRLEPYKKVDLAMKAFAKYTTDKSNENAPHLGLIIVGKGTQKPLLQKLGDELRIAENLVWLEDVSDEELAWLYTNSWAFIMPQEEDFGYVAQEASTCGALVVAFAEGGQREILNNYPRTIYFDSQTVVSLVGALEKIDMFKYNAGTYENCNIRGGSGNAFVATFTQKITQTIRESHRE